MNNTIPVFYNPHQNCATMSSFSPSANKPAEVIQDWLGNEKIASEIEIKDFAPASVQDLYLAHSRDYVNGVLQTRAPNGFGTKNKDLAASLPFTTGSMLAATKHVLTRREHRRLNVAVSPTSGFHHAGHAFGGGYCTFNGLMVAAIHAHMALGAKNILILDMDNHYGNGTQDIINHLNLGYITHITAEKSYNSFATAFEKACMALIQRDKKFDLVLYQAGADQNVDDPLGGIMTTEQMRIRDAMVFEQCMIRETPLVWNLAGGYQRDPNGGIDPVLALHRQTMLACINVLENSP